VDLSTSLPDSYGELILFTGFGFFGFALGLSDSKQMAGALLLSYMAYGNLSPFSAVNLVIAGLTKTDSMSGFRQNWLYVLAVVFVGTFILTYLPL
jgi:hypothetical protein